jgi:hypothetical protein
MRDHVRSCENVEIVTSLSSLARLMQGLLLQLRERPHPGFRWCYQAMARLSRSRTRVRCLFILLLVVTCTSECLAFSLLLYGDSVKSSPTMAIGWLCLCLTLLLIVTSSVFAWWINQCQRWRADWHAWQQVSRAFMVGKVLSPSLVADVISIVIDYDKEKRAPELHPRGVDTHGREVSFNHLFSSSRV